MTDTAGETDKPQQEATEAATPPVDPSAPEAVNLGEPKTPAAGKRDDRAHARALVAWRAQVILHNHPVHCKTVDISEMGVGLEIAEIMPISQVVDIALQVPSFEGAHRNVVVTGKAKVVFQVLRSNVYRAGLLWQKMDDPGRVHLLAMVKRLLHGA